MRGERRPSYVAANIVDAKGGIKYSIIPAMWLQVGTVVFALLIVIAVVMGLLVIINRYDIQDLKKKVEVQETGTNVSNTYNSNR